MPDRLKIGEAGGREEGKTRDKHMKNITDTHTELYTNTKYVISSKELFFF